MTQNLRIKLEQEPSSHKHYFRPQAIADEDPDIPYPLTTKPELETYRQTLATEEGKKVIQEVYQDINNWFLHKYQGNLFLALDRIDFPQSEIGNHNCAEQKNKFAEHWSDVIKKIAVQKGRKFSENNQLTKLLEVRSSDEPCKVCHRDDKSELQPLKNGSTVMVCDTCQQMLVLGAQIFRTTAIVRRQQKLQGTETANHQYIKIGDDRNSAYYYLYAKEEISKTETEPVWLINNWNLARYRSGKIQLLLLGNYGKKLIRQKSESDVEDVLDLDEYEYSQGGRFIRAEEMASIAEGIDRVG